MTEIRDRIKRLERLIEIRQIAVDEAESRVRQSEAEVRRFQGRLAAEEGKIRRLMEEFAHPGARTGFDLQQSETAAQASRSRARRIVQDIENAGLRLEERRQEWMHARRERKTIEKLRVRQLQYAIREEEGLARKMMDETSITRYRQQTDQA